MSEMDLLVVAVVAIGLGLILNLLLTLRLVAIRKREYEYAASPYSLHAGQAAPAFVGRTLDGVSVSGSDYAGRELALLFISAECPACRDVLPRLIRLHYWTQRAGVEMVMIGMDSTTKVEMLVEEFGSPIPVLIWSRRVRRQFNPRNATPFYCYIDDRGLVQSSGSIGSEEWRHLEGKWETAGVSKSEITRYM